MTKYDWLELVIRALGVWFVATGVISILVWIEFSMVTSDRGFFDHGQGLLRALGTSFVGTLMTLLAPGFVGWLEKKDAQARSRGVPQQHGPQA